MAGEAAKVSSLDLSSEFWTWFEGFAAPRLGNRAETFRKMFEHLDTFDRPVRIVETGCVDDPENWLGNGCSTILFDHYAQSRPGSTVQSVDIDLKKVIEARALVSNAVAFDCGDSVEVLGRWARSVIPIDLLYLDASDLDRAWLSTVPAAHHHLAELLAAMPALRDHSMVVVDDAPALLDDWPRAQIGGKGEFVARYAFSVGADLEFLGYQAGWTNILGCASRDEGSIRELIKRARVHVEADRPVAAGPLYDLLLRSTLPPWTSETRVARGEACIFFAKLALTKQRYGTALDWYREALVADPAATDYRLDLARKCYLPIGMIDAAVSEARRAVEIAPEDPLCWRVLGGLEHERRELRRAEIAYDKAIEVSPPHDPDAALDRATLALDQADYDLTKKLCYSSLNTKRDGDALHILAMVAYRESRHEDAIELFDRAISAGCMDVSIAHWHKSLTMEAIGQWPGAWAERAWRASSKLSPMIALAMTRFNIPLWDGETGPARVHVHAESGSGDNLATVRYLPLMLKRGLSVCYETMPDMLSLMSRSFPDVEVVPRTPFYPDILGLKSFDFHCPIGHLQHAFRTSLETVPNKVPYLKADPALVEAFRDKLPPGRRVGLCWSSGIRLKDSAWLAEYGRRKSMTFSALEPVWGGGFDATFFSLQVGPERDQRRANVEDILSEEPTWDETAALIDNLDLVITVDTGVAHLAGALGKPTWVMCQRDASSWHFMCWRPGAPWNERSPWYPTARLFRQHDFNEPHYWDEVVRDVAKELRNL